MRIPSPGTIAAALAIALPCGGCGPTRGRPSGDAAIDSYLGDVIGPGCQSDAWASYGHDAQRTFASGGCVPGPVHMAWRYVPTPAGGRGLKFVFHAIAQADAVYLQYAAQDAGYVGTTAIDRVTTSGAHVWTYDSGTDNNQGNWASFALGYVVLNDDGSYWLDPASGAVANGAFDWGTDTWGQTTPDLGGTFYEVNAWHVDGYGLYLRAKSTAGYLWTQSYYGACRIDAADQTGGIAVDGGSVFYAPNYSAGAGVTLPFATGVYAFDASSGGMRWTQAATPTSTISAGSGHVYLIENQSALVARNESDGTIAWSQPVTGPGAQAPVLAVGSVIVAAGDGIHAFDAASGAPVWTASVTDAAAPWTTMSFMGGCTSKAVSGASALLWGRIVRPTTTLLAALGSGTLVAAGTCGLHVLSLASGAVIWSGTVNGASGRLRDPALVGGTLYAVDDGGLLALVP